MFAEKVVLVDLKPQSQDSSSFNSGKAFAVQAEINSRKVDIDRDIFKKEDKEKLKLKEAKMNFKFDMEKGRDKIIKSFIDSKIPNWNISFVVR